MTKKTKKRCPIWSSSAVFPTMMRLVYDLISISSLCSPLWTQHALRCVLCRMTDGGRSSKANWICWSRSLVVRRCFGHLGMTIAAIPATSVNNLFPIGIVQHSIAPIVMSHDVSQTPMHDRDEVAMLRHQSNPHHPTMSCACVRYDASDSVARSSARLHLVCPEIDSLCSTWCRSDLLNDTKSHRLQAMLSVCQPCTNLEKQNHCAAPNPTIRFQQNALANRRLLHLEKST